MCFIVLEDIKFFPVSMDDLQYGYDLWKLTQREFLEKTTGEWNDEIQLKICKDECIRNIINGKLYNMFHLYEKTWELHPMAVIPKYQGKGYGKILLIIKIILMNFIRDADIQSLE